MSSVGSLYNVPSTPEEFGIWSFAHMAHHRDIIRVIRELTSISLSEYILDPFDPERPNDWAALHQVMHQQMDDILGIDGYNLLQVSFEDQSLLGGWIFLNADEHKKAANILGIG